MNRTRAWRAAAIGASLAASAATAHAEGLDGERFVPAVGAAGGLEVERPIVPLHLGWSAGLFVGYANDPVVTSNTATGAVLRRPLEHALSVDLTGSIGLFGRLELGVGVPIRALWLGDTVTIGGETLDARPGFGDLRFVPKLLIFQTKGRGTRISLGAAAPLTFPTGVGLALRGAGGFTVEPKLLFGADGSGWGVAVNAGFRLRAIDEPVLPYGHELTFGLALTFVIPAANDLLAIEAEAVGGWNFLNDGPALTELPLEARGALVLHPHPMLAVYLGGGAGLSDGLGSPDFRLFAGVRVSDRIARDWAGHDRDKDGVSDARDRCPTAAEDRDGYEDWDGCKEADDRDGDGIIDRADRCPTKAEDEDGFEDGDGCPEADNDRDGILDDDDECPDQPEEHGGDRDGCPEKVRVTVAAGKITIFGKVLFKTGSATILPSSKALLDELAAAIRSHPELGRLVIEGHTDDVGDADSNLKLSEERAGSVRKALIDRGVPGARMRNVGYGETRPIAPNKTPAGRATNRRVEFIVEK
jgi:outer membrane protein OmpA-like peptidoglycan-associated protein